MLVFPPIPFILPTLFIVLIGPAAPKPAAARQPHMSRRASILLRSRLAPGAVAVPRLALGVAALRDGRFLDRDRAVGWCGVLLAVELVAAAFFALGTHGAFTHVSATTTDFSSFYAAGRLALGQAPALAYDQAAHYAAQQAATLPGVEHNVFFYPPVFLLLCAPLALLPYMAALVAFAALGLALYLPVAARILKLSGASGLLPLLAFPSVVWSVGMGQNALFTAAILGGGLLLLDRRPWLAGMVLGLLCYKPHFGVLLPVALAAGQHWRAFAATALSVALLVGLSVALFGWQTWHAYLVAFAGSGSVYTSGKVSFGAFVTPFGAALLLGAPVSVAIFVQACALVLAAGVVVLVWRGAAPLAARASVLLAATLLAVPLALFYDLMPLALGIFWLARQGRRDGFLPWEKSVLAAVYAVPLLSRYIGIGLHLPLGPLASLAVLAFGVLHARAGTQSDRAMVPAAHGLPVGRLAGP